MDAYIPLATDKVPVDPENSRLKPQISHGFLAPFEGFPDASPGVLQVWENVGIQVIMGLSTGIPMARRLPPPIMGPTGIPMHPSGWDSLDAYIPLATDKVPVDPVTLRWRDNPKYPHLVCHLTAVALLKPTAAEPSTAA